ncbi:MAG: hypothetical protein LBF12_04480 [Christensenellaceae bacterium]|jgi:hypothetical protein|nr:hypothetical protein [Christensenellaceae bacterium]
MDIDSKTLVEIPKEKAFTLKRQVQIVSDMYINTLNIFATPMINLETEQFILANMKSTII